MRRIVYALMVSLDGFVEGPGGDLGWSTPGEELHKYFNDLYLSGTIDTSLYGRRMYEIMASYWPTVKDDSPAPDVEKEFARLWMKLPKIVYSNTLDRVDHNAKLVRKLVPEDIRSLKEQPGGDIDIGGAELAASFMREGFIDEFQLYVHPVTLGGGKPMFPPEVQLKLRFVESRRFSCGVVMLRYVRET
jgi:dihydrofolate reductase